ncbi:hypothetical protein DV532_21945 [Pseudomonas sp. Leaf58]|uniref:hypothetical protein n=1 Tax=Pseudomonas sp. Leaf58 TaxID=1736226 RepID=UPI0007018875|nr:hypothetical protein [Pseudomonas sp. Leaf58]AYG46803.1 hypothetical protein DV532_21945 [Pseudomonas sp. Leaf58]KQN66741.1 hypothetical protein ASF02_03745 [Pseudomonas sp. Leaf58]
MKSRIWQLAGVGVLGLSSSVGAMAEGPGEGAPGRSLNSRDEVHQTQPPRQGYYQDIPRRHGNGWHYGARVQYLPAHAREVWLGGTQYFLVDNTYYQYLADSREYVVVNPPAGAPAPINGGYDVVAYPMYGQGLQQQDQDRYQCHRWAVNQSGFDPATASYAPPANVTEHYRRALGACFSGRGYSIN